MRVLSVLVNENRLDIASSMKNTNHIDTVCQRQIKDDVFAHHKAPKIRIELRPSAAESRSSRQEFESFVDFRCQPVSAGDAISGNVRPDFGKIKKCMRAFEDDRHLFMRVILAA